LHGSVVMAPKPEAPFIKWVAQIDPMIDLLGPSSAPAKVFNGTKPSPACFFLPEASPTKKLLPSSLVMNRTGAKMTLRIMGHPVATRIVLDVRIGGANISRRYENRLEFYLGMPRHVQDLDFELLFPNSASNGEKPKRIMLTWRTRGGLDTGTGLDLTGFDSETKATLSFMMSLGGDASMQESKTVRLFALYASDLEVALQEIMGGTIHRRPWDHYDDIGMNKRGQRAHVHA
jgi:hypothetical protein